MRGFKFGIPSQKEQRGANTTQADSGASTLSGRDHGDLRTHPAARDLGGGKQREPIVSGDGYANRRRKEGLQAWAEEEASFTGLKEGAEGGEL